MRKPRRVIMLVALAAFALSALLLDASVRLTAKLTSSADTEAGLWANKAGDSPYTITLRLIDATTGATKAVRFPHNLVTTAGKNGAVARLLDGTSTPAVFNWIGVGDGNGSGTCAAANAADTVLGSELGTRQQDTDAEPDPPSPTGKQSIVVTFAAGNATGSLCEVGLFNASTVGTMMVRSVFGVITKAAPDALQVTVSITVSRLRTLWFALAPPGARSAG